MYANACLPFGTSYDKFFQVVEVYEINSEPSVQANTKLLFSRVFSYCCWTLPSVRWCQWRLLKSCRCPPRPGLSSPPPQRSIAPHVGPALLPVWKSIQKTNTKTPQMFDTWCHFISNSHFCFSSAHFPIERTALLPETSCMKKTAQKGNKTRHWAATFSFMPI